MSASRSTPVAKRIAQAALIVRLQDAIDGCDTVERMIVDSGASDWTQGRAEGTALHAAQAAQYALTSLRVVLQIRLGWPEVTEAEGEPVTEWTEATDLAFSGPSHLPSTDPPVTAQEDIEFGIRRNLVVRDVDRDGTEW